MSAIQKLKTLLTVFLSLVIGLVLYTSPIAFADSPYKLLVTNVHSIEYGVPLNSSGFFVRNKNNDSTTPFTGEYLTFSVRDSSNSIISSDFTLTVSNYDSNSSYNSTYDVRVWDSTTNSQYWIRDISLGVPYTFTTGHRLFININVKNLPRYHDLLIDVSVDGVSLFYDYSFDDGYSAGFLTGYSEGYSAGVSSVDTLSYYNAGLSEGYQLGYSDGLSRGSGDSPLSSVNRFYVPIDNYSVNATGNNNIFLNADSFNNVWSAQEYYDLTGQTQFINTWLINTVTSSALRVTDGTFLVRAGSPFRISNIQIPKGAYPVITFHGVFVAGVGIGSNGSYAVNAPGVSGGVVYMPYSSFKLQLTRSTGISVSSLRAWFGDSNNQQFQSSSTVSSANASASYIFNSVDLDCFRADFEVSVTGPDYYFVSIGYYYDDPNSNLLAEILDRLDNGNSSTSSVVDKINGAIQSFDSSVSTINDFEDSMLGSFNNSSGTVTSTVSNFSFGRQFLNAANWISTSMQRIYSSSSHFQMFWVFPIILAVALVFIGGGIGSKHD